MNSAIWIVFWENPAGKWNSREWLTSKDATFFVLSNFFNPGMTSLHPDDLDDFIARLPSNFLRCS